MISTVALAADPIKIEAEAAQGVALNGGVTIANSYAGFSGTGYAWNFTTDADNIAFTFAAPPGSMN